MKTLSIKFIKTDLRGCWLIVYTFVEAIILHYFIIIIFLNNHVQQQNSWWKTTFPSEISLVATHFNKDFLKIPLGQMSGKNTSRTKTAEKVDGHFFTLFTFYFPLQNSPFW